jgi:hypothetical protein
LTLARCLVTWDSEHSKKTLIDLNEQLASALASLGPYEQDRKSGLVNTIAEVSKLRIKIGDPSVLKDYEVVVLRSKPNRSSECVNGLKIMAEHPQWGERVAKKLFLEKGSEWAISRLATKGYTWCIDALLDSDLDRLPALQESVIRALNDKSVIGIARWDGEDQIRYSLDSQESGTLRYDIESGESKSIDRSKVLTVRVCDFVAHCLNERNYKPDACLYWDEKVRDGAIKKLIVSIRKDGLAQKP